MGALLAWLNFVRFCNFRRASENVQFRKVLKKKKEDKTFTDLRVITRNMNSTQTFYFGGKEENRDLFPEVVTEDFKVAYKLASSISN